MRKLIIGLVVLMVLGSATYVLLPKPKASVAPSKPQAKNNKATLKPWNGTEEQVLNSTFVRSGKQLTLIAVDYYYLNTPQADVAFHFSTPRDPRFGIPRWLTSRRFVVRSNDGVEWVPRFHPVISGANVVFALQLSKLPTTKMAENALGLIFRLDSSPFSLGLFPPTPPPGHRLAEEAHRPDSTSPTLSLKPRHHGFSLVAKDDNALARVVININGHRFIYAANGSRFARSFHLAKKKNVVRAVAKDQAGHLSVEKIIRVP